MKLIRYFVIPVLSTFALFGWWLYAITSNINFVHSQPYPGGGHGTNVIVFNFLLVAVLAIIWVIALVLHYHDED